MRAFHPTEIDRFHQQIVAELEWDWMQWRCPARRNPLMPKLGYSSLGTARPVSARDAENVQSVVLYWHRDTAIARFSRLKAAFPSIKSVGVKE